MRLTLSNLTRIKHSTAALLLPCLCAAVLAGCGMKLKTSTDYLISGNEFFKAGDYKRAEVDYQEALKLEPNNATTILV